jgi:hypothetical protein
MPVTRAVAWGDSSRARSAPGATEPIESGLALVITVGSWPAFFRHEQAVEALL